MRLVLLSGKERDRVTQNRESSHTGSYSKCPPEPGLTHRAAGAQLNESSLLPRMVPRTRKQELELGPNITTENPA